MTISRRSPFDGSAARCIDHYNNHDSKPILTPSAAEKNAADQDLDIATGTGTGLTDRPTVVLRATSATRDQSS